MDGKNGEGGIQVVKFDPELSGRTLYLFYEIAIDPVRVL